MVQTQKKIAFLHRYPADRIKETNASFPYLQAKAIDVLTFKNFDRLNPWKKFFKEIAWLFYAPMLVLGKGYDVIYCDDSYPFYPFFVMLASPRSKVILRIGDFHLMYHTKGLLYKFLHFFEKKVWRLAYGVIAISEAMAKKIESEIGQKVHVVLDPVDPKDFPINKSKNHGSVMFHGYLSKNKGVELLIKAAERLPEVNFVVIGDGPAREWLEMIAPINVFFQGWVPFKSISRHIATCAVGVALRTDNPGNEYVVTSPFLQYGICGKPCLVTRRKVFGDYEWQFSGVDEMVSKIKALLISPFEHGERLREYVLKNHDAEKIAEEIWRHLSA